MPTLPNMSLVTPTLGGDSGVWDDRINACLGLVDAHDHTSGKGVAIVSAALNINADVAWASYGLTGVGRVDFNTVAALAAGANVLFVSSADGELYWRNTGGTNVKLTSGSTLNISLVGGIAGDYTAVGAEVAFSDADQVYTFKDQSSPTKKWARMASGPVRIYENDTTETVYVEQVVAAALASSYTVTWPAALPGAAALMQISSAGLVSYSNTLTQAITFSDDLSITLGGSGHVKHGLRYFSIGFGGGFATAGTLTPNIWAAGPPIVYQWVLNGGTGVAVLSISGLQQGWRIREVLVKGSSANAGTVTITRQVYDTAVDMPYTGTGNFNSAGQIDCAITTPPTLATGEQIFVRIAAGAGDVALTHIRIGYDYVT